MKERFINKKTGQKIPHLTSHFAFDNNKDEKSNEGY